MAPSPARISAPRAPAPDVAQTRAELVRLRPDLVERFDQTVPAANAAILGRLLTALRREPLPRLTARGPHTDPNLFRVVFTPGTIVIFPTTGAKAVVDGGAVSEPGALARLIWPESALATELDNSVANLALAMAAQPGGGDEDALRHAEGDPDGLGRLEQLVLDGHPLHPCCRTREGMTTEDVLRYAPEHRVTVRLRELAVPPDAWRGDGPPVLLAHPWQARRLLAEHPWLRDVGETGPMRPLMSLRTFAPTDGGPHVKTAVDVRMTSAVRTVSPAAVHNGPRLSALLSTMASGLEILRETGTGQVRGERRMAHLIREAPQPGEDEAVVPLGALGAGTPPLVVQAVSRAGGDPYRWLEDLAKIWWPPLMHLLDRGVALEAHGQNTLVGLRKGRPARLFYRDFGGVRVSAQRLQEHGYAVPELIGDLPCDDPAELRSKVAAAALGAVATELITLLERHLGADRARLWAIIAGAIRRTGTADAEALITEPLPVKATTAMRLAAEPLDDVWCHLDNPMAGAR
ncbi:iron transporter [Actinoplanes sp. NBRC 103695]|nr:iron transporter [Actinoplanes sp. NBRC 103695]